jgi:hypothetical protein
MNGYGCKRCTGIYCQEDFIEKATAIHNGAYDYSKVEYTKSIIPVKIICKVCGVFEQSPNSHLGGRGCPNCVNKTQNILHLFLKTKHPNVVSEYSPDWLKYEQSGKKGRFDFYLADIHTVIELDGRQHFQQVRNWLSPEEQINKDVWKTKQANLHGIYVIRLLQEEVYKNGMMWLEEQLSPELNVRDTNMILASEHLIHLYDKHIELLEDS